jgi:hypothetical protein
MVHWRLVLPCRGGVGRLDAEPPSSVAAMTVLHVRGWTLPRHLTCRQLSIDVLPRRGCALHVGGMNDGQATDIQSDDRPDNRWVSFVELAARRGISKDAAHRLVRRKG